MYKLTDTDSVTKVNGNRKLSIPADPANSDYAEYLEWVDEGMTVFQAHIAAVKAAHPKP